MGLSGVNLSLIPLRERAKPVGVHTFVVGLAAWAAGALIAFRFVILSSFDLVFGDRGDGRLNVYFHEHLFNAFRGRARFLSPAFLSAEDYWAGLFIIHHKQALSHQNGL